MDAIRNSQQANGKESCAFEENDVYEMLVVANFRKSK